MIQTRVQDKFSVMWYTRQENYHSPNLLNQFGNKQISKMVRQGHNESMLPLVAGSIEIVQIHNVASKTITYDIVMLRLVTVA